MALLDDVAGEQTPPWRTTEIADLAAYIRNSGNLSACNSLVDLLEEAGFDDQKVLNDLREWARARPVNDYRDDQGRLTYFSETTVEANITLALIASRESASAVESIRQIVVSKLPSGYDVPFILNGALDYLKNGDVKSSWDWDEDVLEGTKFWDYFDIVMARNTPQAMRGDFFVCGCW